MMLASIAEVQPVLAKGKYGPVPMLSDKVIKTVETRETLRGKADLKAFAGSIRVDESQRVFGLKEPDTDYLSKKEQQYLDKWIDYCREKEYFTPPA